ncbi:hypothetical protein KIN20_005519 [Parelaphostrongylus tenuis]|uniref:Uncharacterized protein n=1 Tax=Parelaphostrongylus tenuis TaxID=148309 RepID=A0AAD5MLC6_PARTN|nr:hypothetical protein KIN20_005519 [Parelaphostrongylus tenuis]
MGFVWVLGLEKTQNELNGIVFSERYKPKIRNEIIVPCIELLLKVFEKPGRDVTLQIIGSEDQMSTTINDDYVIVEARTKGKETVTTKKMDHKRLPQSFGKLNNLISN